MIGMRFEFDWDPDKAESNRRKHGVSFEEASGVLADPLALSRPDDESGEGEERWVTLGRSSTGRRYASSRRGARPAARSGSTKPSDPMKDEYDFSKAERGKFYRKDARPVLPVHLDPDVAAYLSERAAARGMSLSELVNALLRKDIELIDVAE